MIEYHCNICDKSYKNKYILKSHLVSKKHMMNSGEIDVEPRSKQSNEEKMNNNKLRYQKYKLSNAWRCKYCQRSLASHQAQKNHEKNIHEQYLVK
jgi:hypothetical protein